MNNGKADNAKTELEERPTTDSFLEAFLAQPALPTPPGDDFSWAPVGYKPRNHLRPA